MGHLESKGLSSCMAKPNREYKRFSGNGCAQPFLLRNGCDWLRAPQIRRGFVERHLGTLPPNMFTCVVSMQNTTPACDDLWADTETDFNLRISTTLSWIASRPGEITAVSFSFSIGGLPNSSNETAEVSFRCCMSKWNALHGSALALFKLRGAPRARAQF